MLIKAGARCKYVRRTCVERIQNQRVDELVGPEERVNKRKRSSMANRKVASPVEVSTAPIQVVDHAAHDCRVSNQLAAQSAHGPRLSSKLGLLRI
jgi:hypothetical protein